MSRVTRKKIKVLHNGPIKAKGWIYGPLLTPYFESTKLIFAMLKDSIKVVEVLNDNSELRLNTMNFDKDNNIGINPDTGLDGDDVFQPVVVNETAKVETLNHDIEAEELPSIPDLEIEDEQIEVPTKVETPVADKKNKVKNKHK